MGISEDKKQLDLWRQWLFLIKLGFYLLILLVLFVFAGENLINISNKNSIDPKQNEEFISKEELTSREEIVDGIHVETGLAYGTGFSIVKSTCLSCHSSKLIIQNRATREGWQEMIRWMQSTQGLPALGTKESLILDYLAEHYAPVETGRRMALDTNEIAWYMLELENRRE